MDALRGHFGKLGFTDVETFIASGNVIFTGRGRPRAIERTIETGLEKVLGYEVKTFVRTTDEVAAIAGYQPFSPARMRAARALIVGFLAEPLPPAAVKTLMGLKTAVDDFRVQGREVYWLCQVGQGESEFSNAVFERSLKVRTTFRGMPTIVKLAAKHGWSLVI